jgi:hypothetical protein
VLTNPEDITVDVEAFFGDVFKIKTIQFEDNKSMSFIAGVYHNENEFSFAKENKIGLFSKKPKSITEKDYLNKIILSSKDSGYFTPVR